MRSLEAIASQIISDVYGGLKGPANFSLSEELIKDEVCTLRQRFLGEIKGKQLLEREGLFSTVCIEIDKDGEGVLPSPLLAVTGLEPVRYAGLVGGEKPVKVERRNRRVARLHLFTDKARAIYITQWGNVELLRWPGKFPTRLQFEYIAANPRLIHPDDELFPAPGWLDNMITGKLTHDYIRYYAMRLPQPNTGTDLPQQAQERGAEA